jgi:adenine-specific DNA-methyltransferase
MIYMDPPYGIKFGSNWQVSTRKRDVKDGKAEDATRQPEQIKAFRDTWELGIHSYLAYMRDRLTVARELLTESGSIFVQIGDENVHLVRCVMDEVFGSENFASLVVFRKTTLQSGDMLPDTNDYILWYARHKDHAKYREIYLAREGTDWVNYDYVMLADGSRRRMTTAEKEDPSPPPPGSRVYRRSPLTSASASATTLMPVEFEGQTYVPGRGGWKTNIEGFEKLALANRLEAYGKTLSYRRFVDDFPFFPVSNSWTDTASGGYGEDKVYAVQTNTKVVARCMLLTTDPGDLVLDPTCGSGTTAFVAEQWGRRWITIDTSRVAVALARSRVMGTTLPYYMLVDSPEGAKREAELTGIAMANSGFARDVRKGFVYKRAPHIMLKSISGNPDIREGMSRQEIDVAIRRHADTELLYDQPYEDTSRIRVTGPFTVESLSPHRIIAPDDESGAVRQTGRADGSFEATILEHLKKAGVQNTFKGEGLRFDRLEPCAGTHIQASGEFTDAHGAVRRVAVYVGPEYGTVDRDAVKQAALEARHAHEMLVVCGFAFDPTVSDEPQHWGDFTILIARMNPDLLLGRDDQSLLKNTGAGNLFMVFGEPDIDVRTLPGGQLEVEIKGLDVYDPTTGVIRSSSTDDIACWFIDTDYNDQSFFVRHAYFTGADRPYEKLQRALRAEINEDAWPSLYSTVSRPFDPPSTGRIAVKVINHYGDEVLKVYEVPSQQS